MEAPAFDVDWARQDTPGCSYVTHFNNAGASLMPRQVLEATTGYLELEAQIGGYEAADLMRDSVEAVYDSMSPSLGRSQPVWTWSDGASTALCAPRFTITIPRGRSSACMGVWRACFRRA